MSSRISVLALALCLVSVGCKEEEKSGGGTQIIPALIASPETIKASGAETTTISVTSGALPIALVTSRGQFENGQRSIQLAALPAFVSLGTCDARTDARCAGPASVTAVGADGGTRSILVTMEGYEDCDNGRDDTGDGAIDCADAQCPMDSVCGANGLTCSATGTCNKCTGNGGTPEAAGEVSCSDGRDNDCDGLVDCADSGCADRTCTMATNAVGVCSGGTCACDSSEDAEATCGDGRDNDCDGRVDCADTDCMGDVCNPTRGLTCSGGATPACVVCPTDGRAEASRAEEAAQCGDGKDNDCDGTFDCGDSDCAGDACNRFGAVCGSQNGVPICGCPSGATIESTCQGGVDEDCDGKTDCADEDCQPALSGGTGMACGTNGRFCSTEGVCACPGEAEVCNNYDLAGAAVDDDCDGRANCDDFDCRPTAPGELGQTCSREGQFGMACDASGTCACSGNGGTPEVPEGTCDDGADNDCDFLVDCQDPDCATKTCGPGSTCNGTTRACFCPGGATESDCDNGVDDNCNGLTDCEEPTCAAKACDGTRPLYICISGACSDPASLYGVAVTPVRPRLPANGVASTEVGVLVTYSGNPKPGVQVAFTLSDPALGTFTTPTTVTTDSLGRASVTFRNAGPVGVATITATVVGNPGALGRATIEMPGIGEIRVTETSIQYPVMGVKTSGWREQGRFQVEVVDVNQVTYPAGLTVTFEHRPLGGSTLAAPLAAPACASTPCVQSVGVTDETGVARGTLYAGTVAGTVRVSATATAGSEDRTFELPAIAVVGAKANAGHFSIFCDPENVPAYASTSCHVSNIDAPFTCVALLKDRYNNLLGRSTTVSFMSEAGSVGQPATTPDYDPSSPAAEQDDLGIATGIVNTLGGRLPKDVTANPGEARISGPADVCGVSERSPRDGVASVIAWTPGEESFFDSDGNGVYTLNVDPFIDLPEPFVDYDDDDTRDGDEPFIDTDGDGTWDPPNGVWDVSTNVWAKTLVVYTGGPAAARLGLTDDMSRWMEVANVGTYPAPTPIATFAIRPAFGPDPFVDCNGSGFRDVVSREKFTDLNANGTYDAGEEFEDCNTNGTYDASLSEPYRDINSNGRYDQFGQVETTEFLYVTAADRNLNRLAAGASYGASKPENAKFDIAFNGREALPDLRGFGFAYQPCLASNLATCALDCEQITSATATRCVLRTRISDYSYGYVTSVTLRGNEQGESDGATEAYWNVTLFGETLQLTVSGTHQ